MSKKKPRPRRGPKPVKPPRSVPAYTIERPDQWRLRPGGVDLATPTGEDLGPHTEQIRHAHDTALKHHPACPACASPWGIFITGPFDKNGVPGEESFVELDMYCDRNATHYDTHQELLHPATDFKPLVFPDGRIEMLTDPGD